MLLILAILASASFANVWLPIITALIGGGVLGSLAGLLKSGAERESIVAQATRQAVEVFEASIEQLKSDLVDAQTEARRLTEELGRARKELELLQTLRAELESEIRVLRARISQLERSLGDK